MLTTFIIVAVLMVIVAIVAVGYPLWMGAKDEGRANRKETTLAILRQQAEDLERDRQQGTIDADRYEEARMEIERRVLEETKHEEKIEQESHSPLSRILAVSLAIAIPACAAVGYLALGRYTAMDERFLQMIEQTTRSKMGHSNAEMSARINDLKKRLEAAPMNPEGWFMLARLTASVNRFDESVAAYKKLNELVPNNADLLADMADMMAAASGKVITPEAQRYLEKALAIDPNQWKALALLAIQAWDKEQYAKAAEYWERLLRVVPPDFPDIRQIKANILEAKRLGGVNDSMGKHNRLTGTQGDLTKDTHEGFERVPTVQAAPAVSVRGTVQLAPALQGKANPESTVFIYARPASGSRMPVAFVKVKVKDLPYNFTLDQTMTMAMGAETLADHKEVIVGARVSASGNFMPQAGDLEGEMQNPVQVGDSGIVFMIDKVR